MTTLSADALQTLRNELNSREENLAAREERLRALEEAATPNWPFQCYAVSRHHISADIPAPQRRFQYKAYALLLSFWALLVYNIVIVGILWWDDDADALGIGAVDQYWSVMYLLLGVPGSWNLWYKPLYRTLDRSYKRKWKYFYTNFALHMTFILAMASGYMEGSETDLLRALDSFDKATGTIGISVLFGFFAWGIYFFACVIFAKSIFEYKDSPTTQHASLLRTVR